LGDKDEVLFSAGNRFNKKERKQERKKERKKERKLKKIKTKEVVLKKMRI